MRTHTFALVAPLILIVVTNCVANDDLLDRVHVHPARSGFRKFTFLTHQNRAVIVESEHRRGNSDERWDTREVLTARSVNKEAVGKNGDRIEDSSLVAVINHIATKRGTHQDAAGKRDPVIGAIVTQRKRANDAPNDPRLSIKREFVEIRLSDGEWKRDGSPLELRDITTVAGYGLASDGSGIAYVNAYEGKHFLQTQVDGNWRFVAKLRPDDRARVDPLTQELYVVRRLGRALTLFRVKERRLVPVRLPLAATKCGTTENVNLFSVRFNPDGTRATDVILQIEDRDLNSWRIDRRRPDGNRWRSEDLARSTNSMLERAFAIQATANRELIVAVWEKDKVQVACWTDQGRKSTRQFPLKISQYEGPSWLSLVNDGTGLHVFLVTESNVAL